MNFHLIKWPKHVELFDALWKYKQMVNICTYLFEATVVHRSNCLILWCNIKTLTNPEGSELTFGHTPVLPFPASALFASLNRKRSSVCYKVYKTVRWLPENVPEDFGEQLHFPSPLLLHDLTLPVGGSTCSQAHTHTSTQMSLTCREGY